MAAAAEPRQPSVRITEPRKLSGVECLLLSSVLCCSCQQMHLLCVSVLSEGVRPVLTVAGPGSGCVVSFREVWSSLWLVDSFTQSVTVTTQFKTLAIWFQCCVYICCNSFPVNDSDLNMNQFIALAWLNVSLMFKSGCHWNVNATFFITNVMYPWVILVGLLIKK